MSSDLANNDADGILLLIYERILTPTQGPRAVRCGSGSFMLSTPALKSLQPRADGVKGRPAVKTVGGVSREQEPAVSGHGPRKKRRKGGPALRC